MGRVRWFSRQQGYKVRHLVEYAADHASSARILVRSGPFCFDSAAYLAHLSLELLLKALLLDRLGQFPAIHSLVALQEQLERADSRCSVGPEDRGVLTTLDTFSRARYPVPRQEIGVGEDDVEFARRLYDRLVKHVPRHVFRPRRGRAVKKGRRILMKRRRGFGIDG